MDATHQKFVNEIVQAVRDAIVRAMKPLQQRVQALETVGAGGAPLDVLDGIDPFKRYQRGVFATFRGGMVRAFRQTDPLREDGELEKSGWHVVVQGISQLHLDLEPDQRTATLMTMLTDGRATSQQVTIPAVLDRGVYKAEEAYDTGDGVTWSGSFWIAQRKTASGEVPGDASGAWRLAVKKGRDGSHGLKGDKGDRGAEGRAGKDLTNMGPVRF